MLIIPAVPESLANDGLVHLLIAKLRGLPGGHDRRRVLMTMVPPEPRKDGTYYVPSSQVRASRHSTAEIPRLAAFEKAVAGGVPVCSVRMIADAGRAWAAYEAATKEIACG